MGAYWIKAQKIEATDNACVSGALAEVLWLVFFWGRWRQQGVLG
jgi:hypothetical protein